MKFFRNIAFTLLACIVCPPAWAFIGSAPAGGTVTFANQAYNAENLDNAEGTNVSAAGLFYGSDGQEIGGNIDNFGGWLSALTNGIAILGSAENIGIGNPQNIGTQTAGNENTVIGFFAAPGVVQASRNVFVGDQAGAAIVNAFGNAIVGQGALGNGDVGENTAIGGGALSQLYAGSNNIAIGYNAGSYIVFGCSNIDIGSPGSVTDETNIIRIGAYQTDTYLAGKIHGNGSLLTGITASQVGADASGAAAAVASAATAFEATLGSAAYTASSSYDVSGAALAATNHLGSAAFTSGPTNALALPLTGAATANQSNVWVNCSGFTNVAQVNFTAGIYTNFYFSGCSNLMPGYSFTVWVQQASVVTTNIVTFNTNFWIPQVTGQILTMPTNNTKSGMLLSCFALSTNTVLFTQMVKP